LAWLLRKVLWPWSWNVWPSTFQKCLWSHRDLTFDLLTSTCNRFSLSTTASNVILVKLPQSVAQYRVQKLSAYDHALTCLLLQGEERSRWLWIHLGCVQTWASRSPTQGQCWWPPVYWWESVVSSAHRHSSSITHILTGLMLQLTDYRSVVGEPDGPYHMAHSKLCLVGPEWYCPHQINTPCFFQISSIWN